MSTAVLDAYVAAWLNHGKAGETPEGQANLRELTALMSEDVTYVDIPSGDTFSGHDGIAQMCAFLAGAFEVEIGVLGAHTDGEHFTIEFESKVLVKETGAEIASRAVAVGTIADGKVTSHRDYWVIPQAPAGE